MFRVNQLLVNYSLLITKYVIVFKSPREMIKVDSMFVTEGIFIVITLYFHFIDEFYFFHI